MIPAVETQLERSKTSKFDADEVVDEIRHEAGVLPQIELDYEADIRTLWVTICPQPKPVFTYDLLASVNNVQRAIWKLWGSPKKYISSPVRFLAFRGKGPIFTLGGDLDFYLDCLAKGDREGLREYAQVSASGAAWNASSLRGSVLTLATIHGKSYGGGIDAPRSCNVMIAEKQSTFCYPEVKFNHFPIAAVGVLSRHIGERAANKLLQSCEEVSAEEFKAMGGLDAVVAAGHGENWLRRYAAESLPTHSARLALFTSFHRRQGNFEEELQALADLWTESMMRLTPTQISKLQRIVQLQERSLLNLYATTN